MNEIQTLTAVAQVAEIESTPSPFEKIIIEDNLPAEVSQEWRRGVEQCNAAFDYINGQATAVLKAGKRHLMGRISLGCALERATVQAAKQGIAIKALYSDYKGDDAKRRAALAVTGGVAFRFSYVSGNKFVKLFREYRDQMRGIMDPRAADRLLEEHAAKLFLGQLDDGEIERMWGEVVTETNLRQALLNLTPSDRKAPTVSDVLDEEEEKSPSWEEARARNCSKFKGLLVTLNDYVLNVSQYVTKSDREAQAAELEKLAKKLRAQGTQNDLPGIY